MVDKQVDKPKQLLATEAARIIDRAQSLQRSCDWRLTVAITNPGGLSAHQTIDVEAMHQGFDWTARQLILTPAVPLSTLTPEQVADITKSVRAGSSWHAYEREKKLRARIKELEAELAAVRLSSGGPR